MGDTSRACLRGGSHGSQQCQKPGVEKRRVYVKGLDVEQRARDGVGKDARQHARAPNAPHKAGNPYHFSGQRDGGLQKRVCARSIMGSEDGAEGQHCFPMRASVPVLQPVAGVAPLTVLPYPVAEKVAQPMAQGQAELQTTRVVAQGD